MALSTILASALLVCVSRPKSVRDNRSGWLPPRPSYALAETIPAVLTDREADPVPDSMGFVTSGCLVDVQDIDGRSVEPGEIGEIVGGVPGTASRVISMTRQRPMHFETAGSSPATELPELQTDGINSMGVAVS